MGKTPTEKNLLSLPPGEHRDPALRGFLVRVTALRARHFEIRYSRSGRQERLSLGDYTITSLTAAKEQARQLLAGLKRGEDPRTAVGRRPGITVAELGAACFAHAEETQRWRQVTFDEWSRLWEREIQPTLGHLAARDLTRAEIRAWGERIARRSGYSANRAHELLRSIFSWSIRRDMIEATPFAMLDRPFSGEKDRDRYLSREELAALVRALDDLPCGFSDCVRLLLLTGVRRSSASLARWAEVDESMWRIPAARTKSGRAHDVPLSTQAQAAFARQRARVDEDAEMVFALPSGDREWPGISGSFLARLRRRMAVHLGREPERWTLHDIRRTIATHLEDDLKVRRDVIAAVLSHANGSRQTRIYALGELLTERREALQRWADWLDTLAGAGSQDELLEQRAAAQLAGVSERTLEQYRSGRYKRLGPPFERVEGRVFYRRSAVLAWASSRRLAHGLPQARKAS